MQTAQPEGYIADEGSEGPAPSEQASERPSDQFASAQAAAKRDQDEEHKARRRDDGVAQVIVQFLTDEQKTTLAILIARLVARDCPSVFLLAILSLINDACRHATEETLQEHGMALTDSTPSIALTLPQNAALSVETNTALADWIVRLERVMTLHAPIIIRALIVDEQNIDGSVLQLTTFVLRDFLASQGRNVDHGELQTLTTGLLHALFQPVMRVWNEQQMRKNTHSTQEASDISG